MFIYDTPKHANACSLFFVFAVHHHVGDVEFIVGGKCFFSPLSFFCNAFISSGSDDFANLCPIDESNYSSFLQPRQCPLGVDFRPSNYLGQGPAGLHARILFAAFPPGITGHH